MQDAPRISLERVVWRIDSKPYERSSSPTGHTARFVPYITAPIVAGMLDEWVGPENWWDRYEVGPIPNTLYCHLSIRIDEPGDSGDTFVITKTDLGTAPSGDLEMSAKGMVSDAFKRAAIMKWGVGRNVYALENLWAPCKVSSQGKAFMADESLPALLKQSEELLGATG